MNWTQPALLLSANEQMFEKTGFNDVLPRTLHVLTLPYQDRQ